jgi:hypothetical protein
VHGASFTVHDSVETQCIASLQDVARLPLGVASTLRRAKSKAPALHCRAESPVINSTGQRPVDTGMYQQPALKGRNPAIDSMMPCWDRMCITVCKRSAAYGYGVHLHSKSRRDGIIPPLRGLWGEAASTPRVTPSASPSVMHIPPFQGYGHRSPLFTGRCPVLLMTGLSALLPPGVETGRTPSLSNGHNEY